MHGFVGVSFIVVVSNPIVVVALNFAIVVSNFPKV